MIIGIIACLAVVGFYLLLRLLKRLIIGKATPTPTPATDEEHADHPPLTWWQKFSDGLHMRLGGIPVREDGKGPLHHGRPHWHYFDWSDRNWQSVMWFVIYLGISTILATGLILWHCHEIKRVTQNLHEDRELGTNPSVATWKLVGMENGVVVETSNHVKFGPWTSQEMAFSHPLETRSGEREYHLLASQAYGRWTSPDGASGWFKLLHGYPQFGAVTTIAMDYCNGNDGDITQGVRRIILTLNR